MIFFTLDRDLLWLFGLLLALLVAASFIGLLLQRFARTDSARRTMANVMERIVAWWVLCAVFALSLALGGVGVVSLFALLSFLALREFITLMPTYKADHRTLLLTFFVITPLQYYLISIAWYGLFSILIPVYAFLVIPSRNAIAGETKHFLERTAQVQWALMICTYCLSYAPALLVLNIPGYVGQNVKLLFFFLMVVQLSDVFQYVWGKLFGKHPIAPQVSPNKTWEGFVGGILSATAVGTALYWITPFTRWQAMAMCIVITLMGFAGGLTMSAIKRDRGVKDYGTLIIGHGGVLDRIDSICFSAPVFFHLTRYFFTP
jgi:phosphatidate cytidylyltransferase